ncbi:MAG: hypothetical protein KAH44_09720, partial [Oricola sp.]|nr:hypothetical protein [Oricola sp.]
MTDAKINLDNLASFLRSINPRDGKLRSGIRAVRRDWKIPLARMLRRHAKFDEIIGVTGSAGKSTTTRLIHAILA